MDIPPRKPLPVLAQGWSEQDRERYRQTRAFIEFLARPESVTWLAPEEPAPESATALVGGMKLLIPLAGLIDKEAELARLEKEISKLQEQVNRSEKKLGNESFLTKAPPAVVEKERARLEAQRRALTELERQARRIQAL